MVLRSFISAIVRSPIAVRLGLFSRTRQELAWQDELLSMSTRFATHKQPRQQSCDRRG